MTRRREGNEHRRNTNRAELVWQMWYGYSPEDAAERIGLSPRTLQRHITALLATNPDPDDFVTREVLVRLRCRAQVSGAESAWDATAPAPMPNGRGFHDYAYGRSRPDLRPDVPEVTDEDRRLAAVADAVARLTQAAS